MIDVISLSRKRTHHKYLVLAPFFVVLLMVSCKQPQSKDTFIIGKVINAKANSLVLRDFQQINDTIAIDSTGYFNYTSDKITDGLYTFSHAGEYQSIYLKKGDSIKLRFNTKAFDESLAFTGTRAQENNYMINLFIEMERDNPFIRTQYYKNPTQFKKTVDSLAEKRLSRLKRQYRKKDLDKGFRDEMKTAIELNSYAHLERYPYSHYGKRNILESSSLPKEYFEHRDQVCFEEASALNNYAYRPYILSLASNLALQNCARKYGNGQDVDRNSYAYRSEKLEVIDSLISNRTLKEQFASAEIRNFIRNSNNATEINKLVESFKDISKSEQLNRSITAMAATFINLKPGNELPDFQLLNRDRDTTRISKQVKKLSVLFFWSTTDEAYAIRAHNQVRDLRKKYPEIDFIGINLDDPSTDLWSDSKEIYRFNPNNEFQILNTESIISQLALRNKNSSMVISPGLVIVDPSINLFHYKIETTLLGYLSQ